MLLGSDSILVLTDVCCPTKSHCELIRPSASNNVLVQRWSPHTNAAGSTQSQVMPLEHEQHIMQGSGTGSIGRQLAATAAAPPASPAATSQNYWQLAPLGVGINVVVPSQLATGACAAVSSTIATAVVPFNLAIAAPVTCRLQVRGMRDQGEVG